MGESLEIQGPRSYDVKEAYEAVAATIDRFLEYQAKRKRLKLSTSPADEAANAFDPKSLIGCCVSDIRARALRDHANIKVAHFFAKNGISTDSIGRAAAEQLSELLDLPTLEDLGPLVSIDVKSNLSMSMSFNGKEWGKALSEHTNLKEKMDAYIAAKQELVAEAAEDAAGDEDEPDEVASARSAAASAQSAPASAAAAASSARSALADPEIPTTIEGWEATIDAALGVEEEEEEEGGGDEGDGEEGGDEEGGEEEGGGEEEAEGQADPGEERDVKEQLQKLLGVIGEEVAKVAKHIGRARFFRERLVAVFPYRDSRSSDEEFVNCAHAWNVMYEFYNMLHHVDKARYYLASTIVFLQQSASVAEGWLKEWEEGKFWELDHVDEFFNFGSHLACRKVCYGDKNAVAVQFSQAKASGKIEPTLADRLRSPAGFTRMEDEEDGEIRAIESPASASAKTRPGTGKKTPKDRLSDWKTKTLAYDDDAGKKADKAGNSFLEKASALVQAEFTLNQAQQALYDLSQNELVQDALNQRNLKAKKEAAEAELRRRWKEHLQNGLSDEDDSEMLQLLTVEEREAAEVCDAANARVEAESSPMLDRFERFVLGILDQDKISLKSEEEKAGVPGAPASRFNDYQGAVAWSRGDDDKLFDSSDPGEMRLARMLLHIYGNIENKPLADRAWIKFKDKAAAVDKQKLAINLAFYAVSVVITVTTGGAGLAVVLPARLALKACKKATHYALDSKGKAQDAAKLTDALKASRSKDPAAAGLVDQLKMDVSPDSLEAFGEKVVAHFLSAQKNMKRLKAQREKLEQRREANTEWCNKKAKVDAAQGEERTDILKEWREETLTKLEAELRTIADELRDLDPATFRERSDETAEQRASLNSRIDRIKNDIKSDPDADFGFDAAEFLDVSPEFSSCDQAAAYVWAAVKFETHYQKFAHYSTCLLAYVQSTLRDLCDFEVYLRKRWGNAKHPGDVGKALRKWIVEQNSAKHISDPSPASSSAPRCATIEPTERTPLVRGQGPSGAKQAVRDRMRVTICYGPKEEDGSADAWAPRYASTLEKVQDSGEKTWKSVEESRAELLAKWDDLKSKRDNAMAKYESAKELMEAAKTVLEKVRFRSLFQ